MGEKRDQLKKSTSAISLLFRSTMKVLDTSQRHGVGRSMRDLRITQQADLIINNRLYLPISLYTFHVHQQHHHHLLLSTLMRLLASLILLHLHPSPTSSSLPAYFLLLPLLITNYRQFIYLPFSLYTFHVHHQHHHDLLLSTLIRLLGSLILLLLFLLLHPSRLIFSYFCF